jgi:azurin
VKAIAPNSVPLAWVKAGALCLLCRDGVRFETTKNRVQSAPQVFEVALSGHQSSKQSENSSELIKDDDEDAGKPS